MKSAPHSIEPLETRIAPAAVFTFTDVDGDLVKITTTLGTNAELAAAVTEVGGQLRLLDLRAAVFQNTNVTASVLTKSATGDGLVNLGRIDATGRDLGKVAIAGDLGQIDAGDSVIAPGDALKSLSVRSMGLYGPATQGGVGDLRSGIFGRLGALHISGDLAGASFVIDGGTNDANGPIGSITIGGSLLGGADAESGRIRAAGDIGPVKIGRDFLGGSGPVSGSLSSNGKIASVTIGGSFLGGPGNTSAAILSGSDLGPVKIGGDLVGGLGATSGRISTDGKITSVSIGGSLFGGAGPGSGVVQANLDLGPVTIGGNLNGGDNGAGEITAGGKITSVTIGGSLLGGPGPNSGQIASGGDLGPVKIGFDVQGGSGDESGKIDAGGMLASVSIGGSLIGGAGRYDTNVVNFITQSGQIFALSGIGAVKIGGDVLGASGRASGTVWAGAGNDATIRIASVAIGGSLVGGAGSNSGLIQSAGHLGPVTVGHSIVGGTAGGSGGLGANGGDLSSVTIGGSLLGGGGSGSLTGYLFSQGKMGTILIKGDVLGGAGERSAEIFSRGRLDKLTIGGSLIGGAGDFSGFIHADGALGAVSIGHDLLGGSIPAGSASLFTSGAIESQDRIGSVFIGGSIISGTDGGGVAAVLTKNASIRAGRDIGTLTVVGGLIGNATPTGDSPVIISAFGKTPVAGMTTDLAIGKISIGGRVEWAHILAGFDTALAPRNADAQIGTVAVGADWIASSIVAGVRNLGFDGVTGGTGTNANNVSFGNFLDQKIPEAGELTGVNSRIASIVISGQVMGTPFTFRSSDSFAFVAEQIGALKVGARTFTLQAGAGDDGFRINERDDGVLFDATIRELGASIGSFITANSSAKLVNASTVTYQDADGDKVTVKFSKSLLTAANVASVFRFDTGVVNDGVLAAQQLRFLDLRPLASSGLGVTFTVVRGAAGDGLVHVGAIESTGFDVGAVSIPGDLGRIDAGGMHTTASQLGVKSLAVRTLGRLGLETQEPAVAGFTSSLQSDIAGGLGALTVRQDIADAFVNVSGSIGPVTIGGSLIGGDAIDSGAIQATGAIGAVKIGQHLQGGSAGNSGKIFASTGNIASVTLGGSVLGGNGVRSGRIDAGANLGPVTIGHNVRGSTSVYSGGIGAEMTIASATFGGSLIGGVGQHSGGLEAEGAIGPVSLAHNLLGGGEDAGRIVGAKLSSVVIGGSLIGGYDRSGGSILTVRALPLLPNADIGSVKIGHNVLGGAAEATGVIRADGKLTSVTIGGSLLGGSGPDSGKIESETDTLAVSIGENIAGGAGSGAGNLFAKGKLGAVGVGGSFIGGAATLAGEIRGATGIGVVKILGNLMGGAGGETARIHAGGVTLIEIGGSMVGGAGGNTAQIYTSGGNGIGALKIRGSLIGGAGGSSAQVDCGGVLGLLTIGGSFVGGSANYSGEVNGVQGIGTATIGGSFYGGSIAGTTPAQVGAGLLWSESGRIASVTIGGSIVAGWDTSTGGGLTRNASIRAADDIGAIFVRGSLHGHDGSSVTIIARGQATPGAGGDVALASLTVGGGIERVEILAGYDIGLNFTNANARIGTVKVAGDWVAGNLFGAQRIAAIQIGGVVAGTASAFDAFSFQAAQIGSFKSFGFIAPLTPGTDGPIALSPTTGDVRLVEG